MTEIVDLQAVAASIRAQIKSSSSSSSNDSSCSADVDRSVIEVGARLRNIPEATSALPNLFAHSAVFRLPGDSRTRRFLENEVLASNAQCEIRFTGHELCEGDETLYLQCIRMSRGLALGTEVMTTVSTLLREQRLTDTGGANGSRSVLAARLMRLSNAHICAIHHVMTGSLTRRRVVTTSGLLKFRNDVASGQLIIWLDPRGADILNNLAYQTWSVRLSLSSSVSRRLYTFISGHELGKPVAVFAHELQRILGHSGRLSKFLPALRLALDELEGKGEIVAGSSVVKATSRRGFYRVSWQRADAVAVRKNAVAVR